MKPKDYIRKYRLDTGAPFNHQAFVVDLTFDFQALVEFHRTRTWHLSIFNVVVKQIKEKFDVISVGSKERLPVKLWNFFYATAVVPVRDAEFGDELKKRAAEAAERRRERDSWKNAFGGSGPTWQSLPGGFDFHTLLNFLLAGTRLQIPTDDFDLLGISDKSTEDEIAAAYRAKAKITHPDTATGSQTAFVRLTEAKNRCVAFAQQTLISSDQ